MIEARIETQLWSQTYNWSMGNVFALQDEIAAAVVDQLKVSLIEDGKPELVVAVTEPMLAGLHDDPRWATFRESLGRSQAQLDAVSFPVIDP